MNITIKSTNLDLTPPLKQYTEEKIGALARFNSEIVIARVELERMGKHHRGEVFRAEITADAPHAVFRAEATAVDMYAAIDLVVPKLVAQLEKTKKKTIAKARGKRRQLKQSRPEEF